MENGRKQQIKPIKGKKQQMDPDDGDWDEDEEGRNDVLDVMENEEPIQPMALEVAREDMERRDALKREQDRLEEERENEERGMDQWVDHVGPEVETPGEIYLNHSRTGEAEASSEASALKECCLLLFYAKVAIAATHPHVGLFNYVDPLLKAFFLFLSSLCLGYFSPRRGYRRI